MLFRRRQSCFVRAVQFYPGQPCEGVVYREVQHGQEPRACVLWGASWHPLTPGDWLVYEAADAISVYSPAAFAAKFEPALGPDIAS